MFIGACSHLGWQASQRYDDRSLSILTVNLFDQRLSPPHTSQSWRADWLLRRNRLELIDQSFRSTRPDLILFQDMLAKRGSQSDSDRSILAHGALHGFEWNSRLARSFDDTHEDSFLSVATSLPLRIDRAYPGQSMPLGKNGFVSFTKVHLENQAILVVNVEMPGKSIQADRWYKILKELIAQELTELNLCHNRLVIGGFLPGHSSWPGYQNLLDSFDLQDSSTGFCELASDCLTADAMNEIYMHTSDGELGSRPDRILIHRSAIVMNSQRAMTDLTSPSRYASRYGLERLWPTRRFAWFSQVRLAKCW